MLTDMDLLPWFTTWDYFNQVLDSWQAIKKVGQLSLIVHILIWREMVIAQVWQMASCPLSRDAEAAAVARVSQR